MQEPIKDAYANAPMEIFGPGRANYVH